MAKRRYKKQEKRQKMLDRGYTECKKCGELSQPGALMCPGCHKLSHTGMKVLAVGVALIVVAAALGIYFTQPDDSYRNPTAIYSVSPTSASASTSSQITVTFTRPMDKSSVEAAFSTSPYVLGTISWSGLALVFTPSTALDEGVTYTVTIGSSAVDSEGEALDCPRWDLTVKTINQFDNPDLYFHRKEGVFIYGVKYPGNASNAGLQRQDIVLKIDGKEVVTLEDVKKIHEAALEDIKKKNRIVFTLLRNGLMCQVVLDFARDFEKE